jgi:N-acetylglucosamine malate deacetylase 1
MKKILAIGAHFDDVELAVGGTLSKLQKQGKEVFKLTLTDNVTLSKNLSLNIDYLSSKKCSAEACKVLGISELENKKTVGCSLLTYSKDYMQHLEDIIFEKKVDTVFFHYDDDLNQDHIAASQLCKTAARHCKNIIMFQSNFYLSSKIFSPSFFVDISSEIESKKKSLDCYDKAHNRFNKLFDLTYKRNQIWGYSVGCEYAEGFVPIKLSHE